MTTESQRKANRQNAKKSTGARTEEGKARSSQNGLKHGLLARDAVMADEDPAEYDRQLQLLEENIFPKNAIEFALVRQIADAEWRLRRLSRIEASLVSHQHAYTNRDTRKWAPDTILPDRDGENQLLGKSMADRTQALANLARYHTHMSRNQLRALNMIGKLRADEARYRENVDPKTGAIHRPSVTDPDPYNTPDGPLPTRYEPPAAVAQAPSRPIGFRANTPSAAFPLSPRPAPSPRAALRPPVPGVRTNRSARDTNHETRSTNHDGRARPPLAGSRGQDEPNPAEAIWNQWAGTLTHHSGRNTKHESRGLVEPQRHPRRAQATRRDAPSRASHPELLMELPLDRGAELVDGDLVTLRKGRTVPTATHSQHDANGDDEPRRGGPNNSPGREPRDTDPLTQNPTRPQILAVLGWILQRS